MENLYATNKTGKNKKHETNWNAPTFGVLLLTLLAFLYQTSLIKESAYSENRAYLILESMSIDSVVIENEEILSFRYTIRNKGKTPAFNVASIIDITPNKAVDFKKGKKYLPPDSYYFDHVNLKHQIETLKGQELSLRIFYTDYKNNDHTQIMKFYVKDDGGVDISEHVEI